MAITHNTIPLQWDTGADTDDVTANATVTSDEFTLTDDAISARLMFKADNNNGTPATDDWLEVFLIETMGDPDAEPETTDEDVTDEHAIFLGIADTLAEDPAIFACQLPIPQKGCKILVRGDNSGTTNTITVSGRIIEQLADDPA